MARKLTGYNWVKGMKTKTHRRYFKMCTGPDRIDRYYMVTPCGYFKTVYNYSSRKTLSVKDQIKNRIITIEDVDYNVKIVAYSKYCDLVYLEAI